MPDAHEDEKWQAYHDTVLVLRDAPGGAIRADLRAELPSAFTDALRALGVGPPTAILTAENPYGENADDAPSEGQAERAEARNVARTDALVAELDAAGTPHARVDGMAPDGDYCERCVAIPLERDAAKALAVRLRQLAFFWWDGQRLWLEPGLASRPREPIVGP